MTTLETEPEDERAPPMKSAGHVWLRWLPIAILAVALVVALVYGLDSDRLFGLLHDHHAALTEWVDGNLLLAILAYSAVYAVAVAISIPGAAVFTIVGGYLFGLWGGTAIVVVAATLGATGIYLAARMALGGVMARNAGRFVQRMQLGFQRDAFSYMLFLRLTPIFPFWVVNLVPALLRVPMRTYVVATTIGIIPGSFVFASFGAGIGHLLQAGAAIELGDVLSMEILIGLCGLAVLALTPIAIRAIRGRFAGDRVNEPDPDVEG